jgi:hypothetical protein
MHPFFSRSVYRDIGLDGDSRAVLLGFRLRRRHQASVIAGVLGRHRDYGKDQRYIHRDYRKAHVAKS